MQYASFPFLEIPLSRMFAVRVFARMHAPSEEKTWKVPDSVSPKCQSSRENAPLSATAPPLGLGMEP